MTVNSESLRESKVHQLNVCGLKCPMPILRAKKALAVMQSGELLEVLATDPAVPDDFAAFARQTGHTLVDVCDLGGRWVLTLQRK